MEEENSENSLMQARTKLKILTSLDPIKYMQSMKMDKKVFHTLQQ